MLFEYLAFSPLSATLSRDSNLLWKMRLMMLHQGLEDMFHFAMTLLSRRRFSSAQLEQHLRDRFAGFEHSEAWVKRTMQRLKADEILNDNLFAQEIAVRYASKGDSYIRNRLMELEFCPRTIDATLGRLEPEFDRALAAAARQWERYQGDEDAGRLQSFLRSRGFDSTDYHQVRNRLAQEPHKNH